MASDRTDDAEARKAAVVPKVSQAGKWAKDHAVVLIAWVAALISCAFVPPDAAYLTYVDWRTIGCLFCLLATVRTLRGLGVFERAATLVLRGFSTTRGCVTALVMTCFFGSMAMTNDAALLTFLPLAYLVLAAAGEQRLVAWTFTLQAIAANLGGMLVPFGSPQNLYLYTYFHIPTGEFIATMLPSFLASFVLVGVCCAFIPQRKLHAAPPALPVKPNRAIPAGALFLLALLGVVRVVPWQACVPVIFIYLAVRERHALAGLDWGLLLTFVAFFVFAGNVARIPEVSQAASEWMANQGLLCSVLASQVISNVPSAVLLSRFTTHWAPLLIGVNIGGVGTPLGSLASLIAINEFSRCHPGDMARFLGMFLGANCAFLGALFLFCALVPLP